MNCKSVLKKIQAGNRDFFEFISLNLLISYFFKSVYKKPEPVDNINAQFIMHNVEGRWGYWVILTFADA